MMKLRKNFESR